MKNGLTNGKMTIHYTNIVKSSFPIPYMDEKISKKLLKLDRSQLTQIVHAITGHNNLRYFSNKINPLTKTHCRLYFRQESYLYTSGFPPTFKYKHTYE